MIFLLFLLNFRFLFADLSTPRVGGFTVYETDSSCYFKRPSIVGKETESGNPTGTTVTVPLTGVLGYYSDKEETHIYQCVENLYSYPSWQEVNNEKYPKLSSIENQLKFERKLSKDGYSVFTISRTATESPLNGMTCFANSTDQAKEAFKIRDRVLSTNQKILECTETGWENLSKSQPFEEKLEKRAMVCTHLVKPFQQAVTDIERLDREIQKEITERKDARDILSPSESTFQNLKGSYAKLELLAIDQVEAYKKTGNKFDGFADECVFEGPVRFDLRTLESSFSLQLAEARKKYLRNLKVMDYYISKKAINYDFTKLGMNPEMIPLEIIRIESLLKSKNKPAVNPTVAPKKPLGTK